MLKMRACKENRMEPLMEITTQKLVNWTWRWALLALGMFVAASGIACVAQAQLGTTPISSTPYVLADIMGLTFGETTFIVNVVFVFLQWVMLRKLFHLTNLCQIPSVFVFGLFIDFGMRLFAPAAALAVEAGWFAQAGMSLLGNVILALGIVMQVESKTLVQPGEGVVLAASVCFKRPFGTVKIVNDVLLVILAVILGLVFLGAPDGVREGTLASAVMVGLCVKGWYWLLAKMKGGATKS